MKINLSICSWNIWQLPFMLTKFSGGVKRWKNIYRICESELFEDITFFCFQEIWNRQYRSDLIELSEKYLYHKSNKNDSDVNWKFNGGLLTLSKWCYCESYFVPFDNRGYYADYFADKGFYVCKLQIPKKNRYIWIINTHIQSISNTFTISMLEKCQHDQLQQIMDHVSHISKKKSIGVFLVGDLNFSVMNSETHANYNLLIRSGWMDLTEAIATYENMRFDYIWFLPNIACKISTTCINMLGENRKYSDHIGIVYNFNIHIKKEKK